MFDLFNAAQLLGGEVRSSEIFCPGPNHSSADRSLSVRILPDGRFVVHSFASDDWKLCRDYVAGLFGLDGKRRVAPAPTECSPMYPEKTPEELEAEKVAYAMRIWQESEPIAATPAEAYLIGRGLLVPEDARKVLRYCPDCPFDGERVPALIAAMTDARSNSFRGIHRTRISPKAKRMLGPAKAAVIRLSPDEEVTSGLHVAEGIETGLALLAMGFRPIWVCLSANGIAALPVLGGIECLTIFADHDGNGTGVNAARRCEERWIAAGREVRLLTVPDVGRDFADFMEVAA